MKINVTFGPGLKHTATANHAAFEEPRGVYVKDFTPESAKEFAEKFAEAVESGQPLIPVVIDSYGGQVYSLMSMVDVIDSSPVPVATVVLGKAMSCGAVLFACGDPGYRFMGPNATLMIHEVSTGQWGKITEVKVGAAEADRLNERAFAILDGAAGRGSGYFRGLVHENGHADIFLTAEQARGHGLVDHVTIPSWEVKLSIEKRLSWIQV